MKNDAIFLRPIFQLIKHRDEAPVPAQTLNLSPGLAVQTLQHCPGVVEAARRPEQAHAVLLDFQVGGALAEDVDDLGVGGVLPATYGTIFSIDITGINS